MVNVWVHKVCLELVESINRGYVVGKYTNTIFGQYYIWSRIANGPDKQIGPFHNEFLIKLALVFFSKLKVPRLLLLYHYIACK